MCGLFWFWTLVFVCVQLSNAFTRADSPVGRSPDRRHLFCAPLIVASRYKVCETNSFVFAALSGLGVVTLWRLLSLPRVCENGWKVCVYFSVCICDSRWRMGRQDGAGDDEWGDRQRRIALYPSVTIPLSLSLSSLSLPVGMMQCLLFSGSEEEKDGGKMGRRWKEKKIAFIHNQCLLRPPFLLLSSHPFLLLLPLLLHFHHLFSCLSSIPGPSPLLPLLIRISCLHHSFRSYSAAPPLLLFFAVSHCFLFFFSTILIRSKEFLPPRYAFSYLISVCTDLPVHSFR